jgi:hypothetical protein
VMSGWTVVPGDELPLALVVHEHGQLLPDDPLHLCTHHSYFRHPLPLNIVQSVMKNMSVCHGSFF